MYNKDVRYRTRNRTLYSGAGLFDLSNMSVSHARSACAGIEGFSLYPVSSKRESRYNEECVTENIAPGIVNHWIISVRKKADVSSVVRSSNLLSNVRAHLALHRSGVLCKGALFYIGKVRAGHEPY